jgi:hypothetical protein
MSRSAGEFGARLRAGPRRRALGGLSRRPAQQMAAKARAAGATDQAVNDAGWPGFRLRPTTRVG